MNGGGEMMDEGVRLWMEEEDDGWRKEDDGWKRMMMNGGGEMMDEGVR